MSGVGITGLIKPLNGGSFPVWEDVDGWGGARTVADNTARDAIPNNFRKEGMLVYSIKTKTIYGLAAGLAAWAVVGVVGVNTVANWFVNTSTGNDNNDGLTSITALATTTEMGQRVSPNGQIWKPAQDSNIFIAAGTYTRLQLAVDTSNVSFGRVVAIVGAISSSAPSALSAVVPTVINTTRGELTIPGTIFVTKKRIRAVDGAQVGSLCYSTGLHAGSGNTYVSSWKNFNTNSTTPPPVGSNVVTDTLLTTLNYCVLLNYGNGYTQVQDLIINTYDTTNFNEQGDFTQGSPYVYGCEVNNGDAGAVNDGGTFWSCRFTGTGFFTGQFQFQASVIQGTVDYEAGILILRSTTAEQCCLDGGHLNTGRQGASNGAQVYVTADYVEYENGTGTAIQLAWGSILTSGGGVSAHWGLSTAYAVGISLTSGAWLYATAASVINFPSTINYQVTAHNLAFAAMPTCYPRANCGVAFTLDPGAAAVTT